MAAFTEGPWADDGAFVEDARGRQVCQYSTPEIPAEEAVENGRLIAAAPEMYAVLRKMQRYEGCTVSGELDAEVLKILRTVGGGR